MSRDIYDDPTIQDDDGDFIKLEQIGDECHGTVLDITVIQAKFGPVLKYSIRLATGREASFLAGSKNLKGQLMSLKPRAGDHLDIKLVELRPTTMGSPLKVFAVSVTPAAQLAPAPSAPAPTPADADDEDMFAS